MEEASRECRRATDTGLYRIPQSGRRQGEARLIRNHDRIAGPRQVDGCAVAGTLDSGHHRQRAMGNPAAEPFELVIEPQILERSGELGEVRSGAETSGAPGNDHSADTGAREASAGLGRFGCIQFGFELANRPAPKSVGTIRPADLHNESGAIDPAGYIAHEGEMRDGSRAKGRTFSSASSCSANDSR